MELSDRPPRSIWYRFRLRKYEIKEKERPKSWAYGNYRQLALPNEESRGIQQTSSTLPRPQSRQAQSIPPVPPVRSITTRLSSVTSLPPPEQQEIEAVEESSSSSSNMNTKETKSENDLKNTTKESEALWF